MQSWQSCPLLLYSITRAKTCSDPYVILASVDHYCVNKEGSEAVLTRKEDSISSKRSPIPADSLFLVEIYSPENNFQKFGALESRLSLNQGNMGMLWTESLPT